MKKVQSKSLIYHLAWERKEGENGLFKIKRVNIWRIKIWDKGKGISV